MANVLVTGASSGIGRELARAFARRDHDLIVTARSEDRLHALADELRRRHGTTVHVVPADLASIGGPDALVDTVDALGVPVDVLVANAGFGTFGKLADGDVDDTVDQLHVNVVAPTRLIHAWLPGMIARGSGGVMAVSSLAAFQAGPGMAVYAASKAYLLRVCEALSDEVRGTGVTVTAVAPGLTRTAFHARAEMESTRLVRTQRAFMDADVVAERSVRAFERGQAVFVPGTVNRLASALTAVLPRAWTVAAVRTAMGHEEGRAT